MTDEEVPEDLRKHLAELEQEVARLRRMVVFLVKEHWKRIGYEPDDSEEIDRIESQLRTLNEPKGTA